MDNFDQHVADTKVDRARHDASVRHQSQLQAFIRGLHKQNRDADREARLAAAAVKDLEAAVAAASKGVTATSPATIVTSAVAENNQKSVPRLAFRVNKPIMAASVAAAAALDTPPSKKTLVFEKKKHAKKVDPDTANWKFEEKTAAISATSFSNTGASKVALALLGDNDDETPAQKPKKALFKKRQIRVNK
jgi:Tfp pilus assembly protein FimV